MGVRPLQSEETARLEVVHDYAIVDTAREESFDRLTALAAAACGAPVALLGFLDESRYWIKSSLRWNVSHLPRASSFLSAWDFAAEKTIVVPDTTADPRFAAHPLVVGSPHVRFHAAATLVGIDNRTIGSIELFDRVPKSLRDEQLEALKTIAEAVMTQLNQRRRIRYLQRDIAASEETRVVLQESEERLRDLFEAANDLIVTADREGRIFHVNRAWTDILGLSAEAGVRPTLFDAVQPDVRQDFRRGFEEVVSAGRPRRIETTFISNWGRRIVVEGDLIPKAIEGETVMLRAIFRDITERKQMEIDLGKARDAALESARLKSQFLTNISHEIRTPMNVIIGMLGLLLESPLGDDQRDLAKTAQASAENLLSILNNILHVSKLEAGRLSVTLSDFDLVGSVERVIDVMKIVGQEKGIEVDISVDATLPAVLRGDAPRVRQVLSNLLSNAIKFTDRGSVRLSVSKEKETESHLLVRFSVTDSGPGITPDARRHLFTPFYQVDGSATRTHEGVGLGLAISKQLVDLLGGVIDCDSTPGEGSTFWFTIPFEKRSTEKLTITARKHAFAGTRVLVIDQSDTSRRILTHYLNSWGIRVRSADDCGEAIERLHGEVSLGEPYGAVIFDLHMADLDGLDFVRRIRSDALIGDTGLIVMTPLAEDVDDEKMRAAGVSAYLAKPVTQSDLFDSLAAVLARDPSAFAAIHESDATGSAAPLPAEIREKVRILVVEDKALNQKLTLGQLRSLGFRHADVAANGAEAIEALQKGEYDVVFMDCQMPVVDGYQATIEIRRRERGRKRTAIIAMTANAAAGDREKCLAAGMDDYLSKPTRAEELDAVLAKWVARER